MADLHDRTAVELGAAVRNREISVSELVEHYLDRIHRRNSSLSALLTVTGTQARVQARQMDGSPVPETAPPTWGVPVALKDLTATAGIRTTLGSAIFRDAVPAYSDDVVGFLRQAGTVSLGKTNVPEFGLACYTENLLGPPSRNPWDLGRMAGGSSGGAAAAVAAGLVPFAQGTDGGGSLRIPASMCGLVGLKTSRGLISRGPIGSDPLGMSVHGPLARNTLDAAALLQAMTVPVSSEPYFAASAGLVPYTEAAALNPRPLRIGRTLSSPISDVAVDPDVRSGYAEMTDLLSDLGHDVVDIELPAPPGLVPAFLDVWCSFAHGVVVPAAEEGRLMPLTRHLRERGANLSAPDLVRALGTVQAGARTLARAMQQYDLVLTPTVAKVPPEIGYFTEHGEPESDFSRQLAFTPWTAQSNLTGQPAISVPVHWTASGLPIGMQFIGRSGDEALLLSVCGQLERACPWTAHTPPLW